VTSAEREMLSMVSDLFMVRPPGLFIHEVNILNAE
jgi:hypothetical protein